MYYRDENGEWKEIILEPSGDTVPIGFIGHTASEKTPTGWLRCDGQEVSRTDYSELFDAIGTTYGEGDGEKTFKLPNINLENRTIIGESDGDYELGKTIGEKEHSLTQTELPNGTIINQTGNIYVNTSGDNTIKSQNAGNQPFSIMQPSIALTAVIKAKQSVGIVGDITSDINDINENAVPNAKTTKEYIDKKSSSNYMRIYPDTARQLGSSTKINLNKVADSEGNKLTLENYGIKIGEGIKIVRISGACFVDEPDQVGYSWLSIRKNSTTQVSALVPYANQGGFLSVVIPATPIKVEEGDLIILNMESTCNGKCRASKETTWLTVEVVE